MSETSLRAAISLQTALAIELMMLKAVDLGLGTCWVASFDERALKTILELDERYAIVALLPVGYPDQAPGPRPRLAVDQLLLKTL